MSVALKLKKKKIILQPSPIFLIIFEELTCHNQIRGRNFTHSRSVASLQGQASYASTELKI
jgi:hypothetical protein